VVAAEPGLSEAASGLVPVADSHDESMTITDTYELTFEMYEPEP
jgi:hypothetical protein